MSIHVEELWSQSDQFSLDLCIGAVARDDLARALLALEGANNAGRSRVESQLAAWAAQLDPASDVPVVQAAVLRALLVDELGLRGDQEDYSHPQGSRLSEVLRRRRGLPILLSVVWMEVGRRAGIPVDGIGLPGHFIVRVGGAQGVYVDPFGGGEAWSLARCRRQVEELSGGQIPWDDELLEPVESQDLLARVCRNLVGAHGQREEVGPLYRALRFLEAMSPEEPEVPLLRARVAEKSGAFPRALKIYRALAQNYAETEAGQAAAQRLQELSRLTVAES